MNVAINRPNFDPWLGFMAILDHVDVFVVLDTIVTSKSASFFYRNRAKTPDGSPRWIGVSVSRKNPPRSHVVAGELELNPEMKWRETLAQRVEAYYRGAPFFDEFYPLVRDQLLRPDRFVVDYNVGLLELVSRLLGISTELRRASELITKDYDDPEERVIDLCVACDATAYFNGRDGIEKGLYHADAFAAKEVALFKQEFEHPTYPQINGPFAPYMGVLDLLFNCGPDSLELIRKATRWERQ